MIDLIAAATVGAIAGYIICAIFSSGAAADSGVSAWHAGYKSGFDDGLYDGENGETSAHARLADACLAKQARIDRLKDIASSQKSVKSARIVAVLDGDA